MKNISVKPLHSGRERERDVVRKLGDIFLFLWLQVNSSVQEEEEEEAEVRQ